METNSGNITSQHYLGIDIGSVSFSYVLIDEQSNIVKSDYIFHEGNIEALLEDKIQEIDFSRINQVAYNHNASDFFYSGISVNEQVALIEGVRFQENKIGSVFTIGGESFGLILFDENNQYHKYISNSSCAAGTGAFLDQQAKRLGLTGSDEISQLAKSYAGEPPKIATRCAVFAKTDIIHCQQAGYSIGAISAGLCKGLAHNIADTLIKGIELRAPVIAVGGVSKNMRVMKYLSEIINQPIIIPHSPELIGAIGCASIAMKKRNHDSPFSRIESGLLLKKHDQDKHYFFPPLNSNLIDYPDFSEHHNYISENVEVDLYNLPAGKTSTHALLGIDIGSTSTKAVVMDARKEKDPILIGLYTRTMGQPVKAVQALLKCIRVIEEEHEIQFDFIGTGTTGSGRKFVQKVINADLAVDEITAHARAAYSLNPKVDTIIEIGGQDSKFTVLKDGQVTFSVMNYVCAAGTGSFIEEQAKRLNVSLSEYARRAIDSPSPLTSDRCTVFMERDLNNYLSQGFSKNDLLAAAVHSVRDNYISKVAHLNKIGNAICFQGATAKNKALVAAFEQKLQKPISVSKYCHLTGAMGVCLLLKEKQITQTGFRGIEFYKEKIATSEDICELCKNHCKVNNIHIGNENVKWGYLCGRDETSNTKKSTNQSGFDLLSSRRKVFNYSVDKEGLSEYQENQKSFIDSFSLPELNLSIEKLKQNFEVNLLTLRHKLFSITHDELELNKAKKNIKVGIPNALYLNEYLPFWKLFFKKLGYSAIELSPSSELLERGKEIARAEFCAPISYWHGQVHDLSLKADYLFLPQMFEDGGSGDSKFYCFYSNYAVALIRNIRTLSIENKCISPEINFSKPAIENIHNLYESLPDTLKFIQTPNEINEAFNSVWSWYTERKKKLVEIFHRQRNDSKDISAVFLGRPYLVMDKVMNKNISKKFGELGIKTFYQDMIPHLDIDLDTPAKEYMKWNHWKYGDQILESAEFIAESPDLYPVFLTAFKCSPDSFVLAYFKEIMDSYQKPYLILQLDEHGSDVGYETRVESAVETFRNHFKRENAEIKIDTKQIIQTNINKNGTVLIPNYDPLSCSLICAAFENAGYNTLLIEENTTTVLSSLRLNDGQCLPISSITQGAIETIRNHNLNPKTTSIFLSTLAWTACNLPQYPLMVKKLLQQAGDEYRDIQVIAAQFTLLGFPFDLIYDVYCSYLFGGLLRRIGCRIRPNEIIPGQTDTLIEESRQKLYRCIAEGDSKETVFREMVSKFKEIPVSQTAVTRPKVAIIGDLYVRDNDVFNQGAIKVLEDFGAEVVTTPFNYILRILLFKHNFHLAQEGRYLSLLRDKVMMGVFEKFEKRFYQIAQDVLGEAFPVFDESLFNNLKTYNLSLNHLGETVQNVLKIFSLIHHYPDINLFLHINPIFCCPGLVSESLFKTIEKDIEIPIVSITYDGTTTKWNDILAPYLHYILETENQKK